MGSWCQGPKENHRSAMAGSGLRSIFSYQKAAHLAHVFHSTWSLMPPCPHSTWSLMPPIVIIRKNCLFSKKFSKKRCHIRKNGLVVQKSFQQMLFHSILQQMFWRPLFLMLSYSFSNGKKNADER